LFSDIHARNKFLFPMPFPFNHPEDGEKKIHLVDGWM
jgi:hypothetical protein